VVRSIIKSLHTNVVVCSHSVRQIRADILRGDKEIDAVIPSTELIWCNLIQGRIEKDDVLSGTSAIRDDDGIRLLVRRKGRRIDN
jgi:hypothetical protein